jgi:hypothetical protein
MRLIARLIAGLLLICLIVGGFALFHPRSPLPDGWNPRKPLKISDSVTPLTPYKLRQALGSTQACLAALDTGAQFGLRENLEVSEVCHIRDRVELTSVAGASLAPLDTRCQTALRLAMWIEHGVKPAARTHLDAELAGVRHASSYNCREMRTLSGSGGRMSTHATAEAVDITGFELTDGTALPLITGWDEYPIFFKEVRDTACTWFRLTLGPDYNRLHADHFHLQHTGWGTCR